MLKLIALLSFLCIPLLFFSVNNKEEKAASSILSAKSSVKETKVELGKIPDAKTLHNDYHIFQSFNNCGPASLSMALSYYDIQESQQALGEQLRPYQNVEGVNDDKSVTLAEMAEKGKDYELIAYHRPNGDMELIKYFVANDMPVVVRTWLNQQEDIGHYRVIKGYDDTTKEIIQDDSYEGKNLRYSYDDFATLWKAFNYEYLVLVPKEKDQLAKTIIGEDVNSDVAWKTAENNAQNQLKSDPDNVYSRFNLSTALYHTKQYKEAVIEFEKVQDQLSSRMLWYQIEPVQAYFALGNYDKVFSITNKILQNENEAFSELYLIRSKIFIEQGNITLAKEEFEKAVFYNQNLKDTKQSFTAFMEKNRETTE